MKIVIFKGSKSQWFFRIVAKNGQIVAQSEAYTQKQNAKKTAKSLRWALLFAKIVVPA